MTTWVAQASAQQAGQFGTACAPVAAAPLPLAQAPANAPVAPPKVSMPKLQKPPTLDYAEPEPAPDPEPAPKATKRHTGHTGHPCLSGEWDGDHDGYCGQGR